MTSAYEYQNGDPCGKMNCPSVQVVTICLRPDTIREEYQRLIEERGDTPEDMMSDGWRKQFEKAEMLMSLVFEAENLERNGMAPHLVQSTANTRPCRPNG